MSDSSRDGRDKGPRSRQKFVSLLSDFFDCTAGAVVAHGGEILSYIGDAVFAIFSISRSDRPGREACLSEEHACVTALAAARDARTRVEALNEARQRRGEPAFEFGLAVHVGDVMYGNIGIPDRLQFTIVGAAANEAAHLATLCKTLGQSILISSAFQRCFANETTSLGFHYLRGVARAQEVFTLSALRSPIRDPAAVSRYICVPRGRDPMWFFFSLIPATF